MYAYSAQQTHTNSRAGHQHRGPLRRLQSIDYVHNLTGRLNTRRFDFLLYFWCPSCANGFSCQVDYTSSVLYASLPVTGVKVLYVGVWEHRLGALHIAGQHVDDGTLCCKAGDQAAANKTSGTWGRR